MACGLPRRMSSFCSPTLPRSAVPRRPFPVGCGVLPSERRKSLTKGRSGNLGEVQRRIELCRPLRKRDQAHVIVGQAQILAHDGEMYPRPGLVEVVREEGPALFAFLLDAGFTGPERTSDGIAYHRVGLHVEIGHHGGHEPVVGAVVVRGERRTPLADVYVAAGCGPAQDVPSNAHSQALARKRLQQHADALRRLLPTLLPDEGVGGGG